MSIPKKIDKRMTEKLKKMPLKGIVQIIMMYKEEDLVRVGSYQIQQYILCCKILRERCLEPLTKAEIRKVMEFEKILKKVYERAKMYEEL